MKTALIQRCVPSAEMEWLCACVSPVRSGALAEAAFQSRPVDGSRLRTLAMNHHVVPLAYQALKAAAKKKAAVVPAEFLSCFHRDYMAIAAHNLRATATLHRLQRLMESNGIRLVPIKGPALALLAYGSPSMRQFEDLDLIVRREDLLRAVGLLEQEGYATREIPLAASRPRYLASLQDWSLQKPGEALHLDLKPVLISHALSGPRTADFMAQSCRSLALDGGPSLWAPGPEAMLLAVCLDGANEMWGKLSAVADAGRLLTAFPGADWAGLLREASRFGQKRSLLVGAHLAEILLDCPLPEAFRQESRQDVAARRLAGLAAKQMLAETSLRTGMVWQSQFAYRTRERMRDRWRFLSRLLFVPGAVELNQIVLPDAFYPLYSCMRPFRLAWDALRGRRPRRIAWAEATLGP